MKAIGFSEHLDIKDPKSLFEFETPKPTPKGHDLLVKVNAVSVNPVDVGVRRSGHGKLSKPKIIGWDACGIVEKVGSQVSLFSPGDRVYYAGSFKRSGSNSEYQLVDERIVGNAPKSLTDAQAAAMPLTSLTAYEALFEQLSLSQDKTSNEGKTILIINGAGGVGSVATQLASNAGLTVIATASRPESINWVKSHGATDVVNHRKNLVNEVHKLGYKYVDYILELKDIDSHWKEMCELIKPEGAIASITENRRPINLRLLTPKKAIFAWEWMYTKSYYHTPDMQSQHDILNKIATLIDNSELQCTLTQSLSPINADNLREAHNLVENGHMIGKVVVTDW
ncbi:Bifunctional protein: zinc-containing alcohol dehydrogenase; quinone oxidoreductase (NADPH:quinone reductase); Similar to arginate lyase [Limosilactobacillus reuteri]|uniref:Zinc-type alcohol dehydrogenase-like protein n=1 Tax=Limosilactobacillus reuteri TaxID=1598 RepID=A0A0U5JS53_LIMRT|nr:zinc-binding alcohol dehydrogenase family protein [Limosilactobacillus reuteri]MCC4440587.1 zinc-binding alcohol dehydrogenase family protein [Limosilactobacillus reuteri]MQB75660.1 zinc-binding alcohol dehydrogenase family protein [Limosilactobacillus reuteri]MQB90268.1 zinc-binding alcohol dehydrogenase family protein [Limosilactobacillus reuteri]MRG62578.1 zinc-binding alcohol dehydrogenase family protein [Limosilactobacillus reuteri]CUR40737.1 Bifunctional protein: zinc-containing alcoh